MYRVTRGSMQSYFSELCKPGFLQVRENWKRSGNLSGQRKSGKMQKWLESQGNFWWLSAYSLFLKRCQVQVEDL